VCVCVKEIKSGGGRRYMEEEEVEMRGMGCNGTFVGMRGKGCNREKCFNDFQVSGDSAS
jgi:hypothetical protein